MVSLAALCCLQAGTLLGVAFVILAVGREHVLAAIGISSLVLLAGAGAAARWLRWWLKHRPRLFGTTISELRRDRARLSGK